MKNYVNKLTCRIDELIYNKSNTKYNTDTEGGTDMWKRYGIITILAVIVVVCFIFFRLLEKQNDKSRKGLVWTIVIIGSMAVFGSISETAQTMLINYITPPNDFNFFTKKEDASKEQKVEEEKTEKVTATPTRFVKPTKPAIDNTSEVEAESEPEEVLPMLSGYKNITNQTCVSGALTKEGQKNSYQLTCEVSGIYHFDTDLSSCGEVWIEISDENENELQRETNAMSIELEKDKTYLVSIEYQDGPCEYSLSIGIPEAIVDITGETKISGSMTYQDQKDRYLYQAPTSGMYFFGTDLSAGGEVLLRISGENGNSIKDAWNELGIELEKGKTYLLSVEYQDAPCNYELQIGVPLAVEDVSLEDVVSGEICYQDQENKYRYTASVFGRYRFDTDLSAGGEVLIRVSGENGNFIQDGINGMTIELDQGKTYIVSVAYRNGPCDYKLKIGVPLEITDVTGCSTFSGNITYQDQQNKYLYTASASGTYHITTQLEDAGRVTVRVSGKNDISLMSGTNEVTIDLEEGKTYLLGVEYLDGVYAYQVLINQEERN